MLRSLIGPCGRMCGSLYKAANRLRTHTMPLLPSSGSVSSVFLSNGFSTIRPVSILPNVLASRGIWIRTKCGRHKKIYKKSWRRRRRIRQHVFTNATQSWLLDTMVTKYWRKPKYIPDDPYNPYHKREEFPTTRKSPQVPVAS